MVDCMLYNLQHHLPIFDGCGDYDVYTEINAPRRKAGKIPWSHPRARIFLPQHYHLQEIHEQYPQATLILNTRPTHEWILSVCNWGNLLARQFANEVHSVESGALPFSQQGCGAHMDLFLTKLFDDHSALVKAFVEQHPSHIYGWGYFQKRNGSQLSRCLWIGRVLSLCVARPRKRLDSILL